jgi:hypothetical protein
MSITARMEIIYRTSEQMFTSTVTDMNRNRAFTCAINGIQYSVSNANANRVGVALGSGALEPKLTTPDGMLIRQGVKQGRLLVAVQPNGSAGTDFDSLKHWLLSLHCDNAIFLDGSDSAMLYARGTFWAKPDAWKSASNTVGLAFYS